MINNRQLIRELLGHIDYIDLESARILIDKPWQWITATFRQMAKSEYSGIYKFKCKTVTYYSMTYGKKYTAESDCFAKIAAKHYRNTGIMLISADLARNTAFLRQWEDLHRRDIKKYHTDLFHWKVNDKFPFGYCIEFDSGSKRLKGRGQQEEQFLRYADGMPCVFICGASDYGTEEDRKRTLMKWARQVQKDNNVSFNFWFIPYTEYLNGRNIAEPLNGGKSLKL